jgi:hypothetical protein
MDRAKKYTIPSRGALLGTVTGLEIQNCEILFCRDHMEGKQAYALHCAELERYYLMGSIAACGIENVSSIPQLHTGLKRKAQVFCSFTQW